MKRPFKPNKKQIFELSFSLIVAILFIVKTCSGHGGSSSSQGAISASNSLSNNSNSISNTSNSLSNNSNSLSNTSNSLLSTPDSLLSFADSIAKVAARADSVFLSLPADPRDIMGLKKAHRILSVSSYATAFPDLNPTQLVSAKQHGITPQKHRAGVKAQEGKKLVDIRISPYYKIAELHRSQPYLVPRAQKLLNRIGRNFLDSLLAKKMPPTVITVTSVTRSDEDITHLQRGNVNATENSAHAYGTTIDISYLTFDTLRTLQGVPIRPSRNDSLKWVLSEVLNDLRKAGACHVKHENKQGCFHITVK